MLMYILKFLYINTYMCNFIGLFYYRFNIKYVYNTKEGIFKKINKIFIIINIIFVGTVNIRHVKATCLQKKQQLIWRLRIFQK
mgnify:CR=1 FL=1